MQHPAPIMQMQDGDGQSRNSMMDNPRAAKRSELFLDDAGCAIEKRCFFLLCGDDDMSDYFEIESRVNILGPPRDPWKINFKLSLHNTYIEICNEIVKSQTQLIPEFKSFFRYDDLNPCRPDLTHMIEQQAVLYLIRESMCPNSHKLHYKPLDEDKWHE